MLTQDWMVFGRGRCSRWQQQLRALLIATLLATAASCGADGTAADDGIGTNSDATLDDGGATDAAGFDSGALGCGDSCADAIADSQATAPDATDPCPGGAGCPCELGSDCDYGICL